MNTNMQTILSLMTLSCLLFACTPTLASPTPAPAATAMLAPSATPTSAPTSTPEVPKEPLYIAVFAPLTGNQAPFGNDMANGAKLAISQLGDPLAALGYKIELITYNDQGDPALAEQNANQFLDNPPYVLCGIGHFSSTVTIAAINAYHLKDFPLIVPVGTRSALTNRGYEEINRLSGRDDGQGATGIRFLESLGVKKISAFIDPEKFGTDMLIPLKEEAERSSIAIVNETQSNSSSDVRQFITDALNNDAEAIFIGVQSLDLGADLIKRGRAMGFTGIFVVIESLGNPALIDLAGPQAASGGGTYYISLETTPGRNSAMGAFQASYQQQFGTPPMQFAAKGYDAAGICMKGIEDAINLRQGRPPLRYEVTRAIREMKDYPGLTGSYTFNQNGDPLRGQYSFFKLTATSSDRWQDNVWISTLEVSPPN